MAALTIEMSFPNADGTYTDFVEVTDDVLDNGLSPIKKVLDSNEYDVGTLKFSKFKLSLRNEHGAYSDAITAKSIFPHKRDETIVRVLWDRNEGGSDAGACECGLTFLDPPVEIYKGLIEDNSTKFSTSKQTIKFTVLGMDSIVSKVETPYASLVLGDNIETLIYKCLNQDKIKKFFYVSPTNINVKQNFICDAIESLEDRTVLETLNELLFLSGAVLYIEEDTLYVRPRDVDVASAYTFYSSSSSLGIESIIEIEGYTIGLNRTFNMFKWADTTLKVSFLDSIERYGLRKKEIESKLILSTNAALINTILLSLVTEFGFPVIEFELTAPLYTDTIDLKFLNKIHVDYPADYLPSFDSQASLYGVAKYGEARYARQITSLFISIEDDWKIMNKTINTKKSTVTYRLRGV